MDEAPDWDALYDSFVIRRCDHIHTYVEDRFEYVMQLGMIPEKDEWVLRTQEMVRFIAQGIGAKEKMHDVEEEVKFSLGEAYESMIKAEIVKLDVRLNPPDRVKKAILEVIMFKQEMEERSQWRARCEELKGIKGTLTHSERQELDHLRAELAVSPHEEEYLAETGHAAEYAKRECAELWMDYDELFRQTERLFNAGDPATVMATVHRWDTDE